MAIRSQYAIITEADVVKVTQAINEEDMLRLQEFTTVLDRRELPETVGIILEITGDIGIFSPFGDSMVLTPLAQVPMPTQRGRKLSKHFCRRMMNISVHSTQADYVSLRSESSNTGHFRIIGGGEGNS